MAQPKKRRLGGKVSFLGFDLLPVPDREQCLELEFEMVRIIGEM